MNPWIFLSVVVAAMALAWWIPRFRLQRAVSAPFPAQWVEILERNIEVYRNLPMPLRMQLRKLIKRFLHKKHFSGAGGLELTDEIRVTIAAQACMLQLNRKGALYPRLKYIIVYPTAFVVSRTETDASGVSGEARRGLLGESWDNGKVILAWDNVLHGARNFVDGQNVVLHEFSTSWTVSRAAPMARLCWPVSPVIAAGPRLCPASTGFFNARRVRVSVH